MAKKSNEKTDQKLTKYLKILEQINPRNIHEAVQMENFETHQKFRIAFGITLGLGLINLILTIILFFLIQMN